MDLSGFKAVPEPFIKTANALRGHGHARWNSILYFLTEVWQEWHYGLHGNPALKLAGPNHMSFRAGDKKWHRNVSNAVSERRQLADFVDMSDGGGAIGAVAIAELPAFNKPLVIKACTQ